MSLKCPKCGEKYFYDRKICRVCEDKAIYSKLERINENKTQKWNCDIFLECDTLAFGRCKPHDAYTKIASEPKFSNFKTKKDNFWNCDSINKIEDLKIMPITIPILIEKEVHNSLIYE
ncbi:MAG: hypothetical protein ACFFDH_21175 [Promethearchaeota archaeon]